MTRSVITWSYRGVFLALVVGSFAGVNGCALLTEGCADTATCGTFDGDKDAIVDLGNGQPGEDKCGNGIDCGNPNCVNSVACNPRIDGWEYRTLGLLAHDPNASVAKCPDNSNAERLFAGHTGQPTCAECACTKNNQQNALDCDGLPVLECTIDHDTDPVAWMVITTNFSLQCEKPPALANMPYCRVQTPVLVAAGACTPQGGKIVETPAWTTDVLSCTIAPTTRADEKGTCLRKNGNHDCPNDWPSTKTVVYASEKGKRECTKCECSGECESEIVVYDTNGCDPNSATPPIIVSINDTYVSDRTGGQYSIRTRTPVPPLNCTPTGGEPIELVDPSAKVTPANPVTFCCK